MKQCLDRCLKDALAPMFKEGPVGRLVWDKVVSNSNPLRKAFTDYETSQIPGKDKLLQELLQLPAKTSRVIGRKDHLN